MAALHSDTAPQPRILVIEDDRALLRTIHLVLSRSNYRVIEATDAHAGIQLATTELPDLVILDVGLPDFAGTELCDRLRRGHFEAPILMVTGLHDVEHRVRGLESGADDYLTKPFDERELLARVAALLRRRERVADTSPRWVRCGDVEMDFELRQAVKAGKPLRLTKTEFALLELLARQHGRPLTRKTILDTIWNYSRTPDTRTVDTHVWRLRKKLGDAGADPRWLQLVAGQGYCLSNCVIDRG